MRNRDPSYFEAYMEWAKRPAVLRSAMDDDDIVFA